MNFLQDFNSLEYKFLSILILFFIIFFEDTKSLGLLIDSIPVSFPSLKNKMEKTFNLSKAYFGLAINFVRYFKTYLNSHQVFKSILTFTPYILNI